MISFSNAIEIIKKKVKKNNKCEKIKTEYAISRIPIKNYYSKNNYPEFDNSAMDGVVINENDYCLDQTYKIVDEIKAGDKKSCEAPQKANVWQKQTSKTKPRFKR